MKKRLFLLFCGVMCLFFVLCSCGDDEVTTTTTTTGTVSSQPDGGNVDDSNQTVFAPETSCPANALGHYWKDVTVNTASNSSGSVIVKGVCYNCGEKLGKEAVSLVSFEEWKNALSSAGLSSFTTIKGTEYTDYDSKNALSWRIKNNVFTQDFYFGTNKNSAEHALNFSGFLLTESYNKFTYDQATKSYVYEDGNVKIFLGFADGCLLSHTVEGSSGSKETTLYVNHGRIKIDVEDYVVNYFNDMTSVSALSKSILPQSYVQTLHSALTELSFESKTEVSYLENGKVCYYFFLDSQKTDPFGDSKYSTVAVIIEEDRVTSVSFGSTSYALSYPDNSIDSTK